MAILQHVSVVALRQLVRGACLTVGATLGNEAPGRVYGFLVERFTDHSHRLTKALQSANVRAWRAFEVALGGESLWDRCKLVFTRAEDVAFREQVREFLKASPLTKASGEHAKFFRQALIELQAARSRGLLESGHLGMDQLAREAGMFAGFDDPLAEVQAEWTLVERAAAELRETCPHLHKILVARTNSGQRPSLLAVAVRFYFRREVEADQALFNGLTFAKLEALQEAQEKGFEAITEALSKQGDCLDKLLRGIQVVVEDTNETVKRIEQQIQQLLEQFQLQNRAVRPSDSMSVRSNGERQQVEDLVGKYRALPEAERLQRPELLNAVGKLEVVTGEFAAAQQDFQAVAQMEGDPKVRAEAYHNAYLAALERGHWGEALDALRNAVQLDPERHAPFPRSHYEARRILGAGGFGVVYLCHHRHLERLVVVKSLLQSELDRDIKAVFAEAKALEDLNHSGIIRLRDCGYADDARTRPYLVMDYQEGVSLAKYVATHGPLTPEDTLAVARQTAEALQVAHARGIFHRDVKPANLLVRREKGGWRVNLIDFGLALRSSALEGKISTQGHQARTTIGRSVAGTLHYAPPEQLGQGHNVPVGTYSDVYGFGKTCYFALLKTPDPDDGEKAELPAGWRQLLADCTRRKAENRLQDFAGVLARLANIGAKGPPASPDLTVQRPPTIYTQKYKGLLARGYPTEQGFLVLAGSEAVRDTAPSLSEAVLALRASLLKDGTLAPDGDHFKLTKDHEFSSSSTAACVFAGASRSGPRGWKDAEGRPLGDVQPKKSTEPTPEEAADSLRESARTHLARGKVHKALAAFDQLVKLEPKAAANFLERGQTHAAGDRHDKAIADFSQAILLGDRSANPLIARGKCYAAKNIQDLAFADFDAALQLDSGAVEAYFQRGEVWLAQGDFERAMANYNQALERRPADARFLNARGRVYLAQGKIEEALREFLQASQRDPHFGETYLNRAKVWVRKGKDEQAVTDLNQALTFDPRSVDALATRARIRARLKQHGWALSDFTKAVKLRPRDPALWLDRGRVHLAKGACAAAIDDFLSTLKLDRNCAAAYHGRGEAYCTIGKFVRAISDYTRALELEPARAGAVVGRAWAYLHKGQYDQALTDATEAIRLGQDLASAYQVQGCVRMMRKEFEPALAALNESLRLNSQNASCYSDRGRVYYWTGDYDRALADFSAAIKLDGKNADYYRSRSRAYAKKGDKEKARADREKATALGGPLRGEAEEGRAGQ